MTDAITLIPMGAEPTTLIPTDALALMANQLSTPRLIDGVAFDGTADIAHFASCTTGGSTAAKTATITGFSLAIGSQVVIQFSNTNSASSPTLNVSGTGAKAIRYKNAALPSADVLEAGGVYLFVYDGTYWQLVGGTGSGGSGSITSDDLAANAVTEPKIAPGAVTEAKVANGAITGTKVSDGAITEAKVGNGAITTNKVGNAAITKAKLNANVYTNAQIDALF